MRIFDMGLVFSEQQVSQLAVSAVLYSSSNSELYIQSYRFYKLMCLFWSKANTCICSITHLKVVSATLFTSVYRHADLTKGEELLFEKTTSNSRIGISSWGGTFFGLSWLKVGNCKLWRQVKQSVRLRTSQYNWQDFAKISDTQRI